MAERKLLQSYALKKIQLHAAQLQNSQLTDANLRLIQKTEDLEAVVEQL
jgi:hypothetical protein